MARAQKSGQVWVLTPANQIPEKGPKSRAFYDAMSGVLESRTTKYAKGERSGIVSVFPCFPPPSLTLLASVQNPVLRSFEVER
jgi:hypothetical protein